MKLSKTMNELVERMTLKGETIRRFPGGFWRVDPPSGVWWATWATPTVQALVKRGVLEYCEFRESHGCAFPIKARLKQQT